MTKYAQWIVSVVLVSCPGCISSVHDWAATEVRVVGGMSGYASFGDPNDKTSDGALALDVKNVVGFEDGIYEITVPSVWTKEEMTRTQHGEWTLSSELSLSAKRVADRRSSIQVREDVWGWPEAWSYQYQPWVPRVLSTEEALQPAELEFDDNEVLFVAGLVVLADQGNYAVRVFATKKGDPRWIGIGTVSLGRGRQSPARPYVAVLAYPVAAISDLVICPILGITGCLSGQCFFPL